MKSSKVKSISYIGKMPVMDITIDSDDHLFYANGFVVSNCKAHAVSYAVYSAVQMWMQEHYFIEYMCCLLDHIDRAKEKKGHLILNERVEYCLKHGTSVLYPDVNESTDHWQIKAGALLAPLKNIKGFSDKEVATIIQNRPYSSVADFLDKTGFKKNRFEPLLFAHAFDRLYAETMDNVPDNCIEDIYNWYHNHYLTKEDEPKEESGSIDLFGDELPEESSASEVIKMFTKEELEEKCLDLNGFVIYDQLLMKYHRYFDEGMKLVAKEKGNEAYANRNEKIYSIGDLMACEVDENKYKNCWLLAKVLGVVRDIKGKFGTFSKMTIGDGKDTTVIMCNSIPAVFRKNAVIIFPVSINDKGKIYVDNRTMEKLDAVILE